MRIRHLTPRDNVDAEGILIDPLLVRHGLLRAGAVADLAGPVDPLTHLNLDFPEHGLDDCLVVERLAVGAPVLLDGDRFRTAQAHPAAYTSRGRVDVGARRAAWQAAHRAARGGE